MYWEKYVPVAERQAKARKQLDKQRKKGKTFYPLDDVPRCIAKSFWGKRWCDHIEEFSDCANRLPRGRTYVRNGSVCHLHIQKGKVEAKVIGSSLYDVEVKIRTLANSKWTSIKKQCSGKIGSLLELLQGKISEDVMDIVTEERQGLLPLPSEISYDCSCPDGANMCKHVAAVLYGIGSRLDDEPETLFMLRDVDPQALVSQKLTLPSTAEDDATIADDSLGALFGIEMEKSTPTKKPKVRAPKAFTGAAIRKLRARKKMTVSQFSRELGVTTTSVTRWEGTRGTLKLQSRPYQALVNLHINE
jgi:uncharacterized Zn finger protein